MNRINQKNAAVLCMLVLSFVVMPASAQPYPSKTIRMIVPSAPGSGPDLIARVTAQKLSEQLGRSVVADPRPGAGGSLGAELAAKAPADGYTLIMASAGSHSVNPALYPKLPYDAVKDFAPIGLVSTAPNILIVHPSLPVKTVKDLIALARAKPGALTFGSGGNGSTAHLSGELFRVLAKVNMVHVPFKGAPSAVIGVMTGEISLAILNLPPALPHVKSGKLKALGVSTAKRSSAVPEIPSIAEAGLPAYDASTWYGLLAPAGTPGEIITRLSSELMKALRSDDMKKRIAVEGGDIAGGTPEDFAALIKRDIAKWTQVVQASGAKAD
ncbi:MAG: tripartite tricarboxylate transporter substrate binding protein [Burkholderiales bacterium]|nr:tripartite tricarboxylate transporter substrate binding protein [Burkholderiales bacterium]